MSTSINYGFSHFDNIAFRKGRSYLRPYNPCPAGAVLPPIWSALIQANADNSPTWRPNGRGGVTSRGAFPSVKVRRAQPFVGSNERRYIHICEADGRVVQYWMQPHRLEMHVDGYDRPLIYFPDVRREMEDGTIEIVELKSSLAQIDSDPAYALKLALAAKVYAEKGWRFSLETGEDNFSMGLLFCTNASRVAHDNTTRITTADWMRLHEHMEGRGGTSSYTDVSAALCGAKIAAPGAGRAKLHALVVRRAVRIDLGLRLLPTTPVHLVVRESKGI
jgi:hypothetical protein